MSDGEKSKGEAGRLARSLRRPCLSQAERFLDSHVGREHLVGDKETADRERKGYHRCSADLVYNLRWSMPSQPCGNLVESVKQLWRAGLQVQGGFIVGFDNDSLSIFQQQIDFIQRSCIVTAMVGLLSPLRERVCASV
jgi:hypothetical protein